MGKLLYRFLLDVHGKLQLPNISGEQLFHCDILSYTAFMKVCRPRDITGSVPKRDEASIVIM